MPCDLSRSQKIPGIEIQTGFGNGVGSLLLYLDRGTLFNFS